MYFTVTDGPAPTEARDIRQEVFVQEQKFQEEFDETDNYSTHIVLFLEGAAIACCRFFATDGQGTYKLGRIAVRKPYRGQNYGAAIMEKARQVLQERGAKTLIIHAQAHAQGFYEKIGYTAVGELFLEENVLHRHMEMQI